MAKNPKVNINVGAKNYVSFSQRLKNAATIRKMWKILRAMDCEACGFSCTNGCQMILNQIRTLELESAGGKSEFVNGLDVSESAGNTVPIDVYLATLQMLADKQDAAPRHHRHRRRQNRRKSRNTRTRRRLNRRQTRRRPTNRKIPR